MDCIARRHTHKPFLCTLARTRLGRSFTFLPPWRKGTFSSSLDRRFSAAYGSPAHSCAFARARRTASASVDATASTWWLWPFCFVGSRQVIRQPPSGIRSRWKQVAPRRLIWLCTAAQSMVGFSARLTLATPSSSRVGIRSAVGRTAVAAGTAETGSSGRWPRMTRGAGACCWAA